MFPFFYTPKRPRLRYKRFLGILANYAGGGRLKIYRMCSRGRPEAKTIKNLLDLSAEVRENKTSDDVVEAIFYKQGRLIPKSHAFLQTAFYRLKQDFPNIFEAFIFDESGPIPFSDELDSVLFRLEASSVLHALNPSHKNYFMDDSVEVLKNSYDKFNSPEIDACATEFSFLVNHRPGGDG